MEAQIQEIATNASRELLNPFLLAVAVVGVLALVTGFAARIAILIEDLPHRRTHRHQDHQAPSPSGLQTEQERKPVMLQDTALGNARIDGLISRARRTSEESRRTSSETSSTRPRRDRRFGKPAFANGRVR